MIPPFRFSMVLGTMLFSLSVLPKSILASTVADSTTTQGPETGTANSEPRRGLEIGRRFGLTAGWSRTAGLGESMLLGAKMSAWFDSKGRFQGNVVALYHRAGYRYDEATLDAQLRFHLTPVHTFLTAYPIVAMGGGLAGTSNDLVGIFRMYGGLGASVVQTRQFQLGANVVSGFQSYLSKTIVGGDDVSGARYATRGFVQVLLEATFGLHDKAAP